MSFGPFFVSVYSIVFRVTVTEGYIHQKENMVN